jgi:hypothetical protein
MPFSAAVRTKHRLPKVLILQDYLSRNYQDCGYYRPSGASKQASTFLSIAFSAPARSCDWIDVLAFNSSHSRIAETLNGDCNFMRQNALRPQRILRIANKFDFLGDKHEPSVRFVFRGCMKFCMWIAFPAMSDVKGGINDSHSRRGPHRR